MARYLVIHTPTGELEAVARPTDLRGLAERTINGDRGAKWLRTWSPDLHDDRQFTLWDAENAAEIRAALEAFGFFPDADADVLRVSDWGPEDVLESQSADL
jgi:hypothetical protein